MEFKDIIFEKKDGVAKITINRPEKLNAFTTETVMEIVKALEDVELDRTIGVVVITGAGNRAFCVGGDAADSPGGAGYRPEMLVWVAKLHAMIRKVPKPVIAAVNGYAIGGGHVMHIVCDLSIASETARFGQAGPRVGSYDAGFGAGYLARVVGEKKAREIWFLCEQYSAQEALEMGLVNKVVPPDKLEEEVNLWCKKILALSPTALKVLKQSFNLETDHIYGVEAVALSGVWLYYQTDEAMEGRNAYLEKRPTDFMKYRK
ncbi:MAG: enoyl-CoA hydratase-related protein [Pseudomonadota bacterium]